MASETDFSRLISRLRPLMKGTRDLGEFTMNLIDMGLKTADSDQEERSAASIRKKSTWKSYANGTSPLSRMVASELAGRWDSYRFESNCLKTYEEGAFNDLALSLHQGNPKINKGNVVREVGNSLYEIFREAAGQEKDAFADPINPVEKAVSTGTPYYDAKKNRIWLGDDSVRASGKTRVPKDIQTEELIYVKALTRAYCENSSIDGREVQVADIPDRYQSHFQDQRKAFFAAEWLKETSWNCFTDDRPLFDEFLDEIYEGVSDTNLDEYSSQVKRLLATLSQSARVQLNSITLNHIEGLIDIRCRKGACHELVNDSRLSWEE